MGKYKLKKRTDLSKMSDTDELPESDFACITPDGNFVQLEYIEEEAEIKPYIVKPGLFTMKKTTSGLELEATSFVKDKILASYIAVQELKTKMDCFFNNLGVYNALGYEVARRSALIYGPAGTGKTTSIIDISNNYVSDGKTVSIIWPTDAIDPYEVKEFIKRFEYQGPEKFILIAEDIGGVEVDQVRIKSMPSLLSLLDNKEKTFRIPIFIAATTNHPENFLGNLTNRPGRFDDKIEVGFPTSKARKQLFEFYLGTHLSGNEELIELIQEKKYKDFSAAHIQETVVRSLIHKISFKEALNNIHKEIEIYNKMFDTKKMKLGIDTEPY